MDQSGRSGRGLATIWGIDQRQFAEIRAHWFAGRSTQRRRPDRTLDDTAGVRRLAAGSASVRWLGGFREVWFGVIIVLHGGYLIERVARGGFASVVVVTDLAHRILDIAEAFLRLALELLGVAHDLQFLVAGQLADIFLGLSLGGADGALDVLISRDRLLVRPLAAWSSRIRRRAQRDPLRRS